jgi:Flp pilus assembly protein TadB
VKGVSPNAVLAAGVAILAITTVLIVGLSFADSATNDTTPLVGTIVIGAGNLLVLLFNTMRTQQTHKQTQQLTESVADVSKTVDHVEAIINGTERPQGTPGLH